VFFVYSHKDERHRKEIEKHLSLLKSQGLINAWHDRMIKAGHDWNSEINKHLNSASLILLLVSADFLGSDYINGVEMKRALELHDQGLARVVPIVLRNCDWTVGPLGRFQALPKDARAVTQWPNRDDAYTDVAKGLRRLIEEMGRES
jgi:hypothetical protein